MSAPAKLSYEKICAELKKLHADIPLYFFEECDNTNLRATEIQKNGEMRDFIAIAASQSAGRGRFERKWQDEAGKSICLSAMLNVSQINAKSLGCFGILAGIEICLALREYCGADLKLKWPNDIYWNGKKLAGMIASLNVGATDKKKLLFGIGINFAPIDVCEGVECAALSECATKRTEINECAAIVWLAVFKTLARLVDGELAEMPHEFSEIDYLCEKRVSIDCAGKILRGKAEGVDAEGRLILRAGEEILLAGAGESSILKE